MGRSQDGLVHMELCKNLSQSLCQNESVGKPSTLELLHSQRTGLEHLVWNTHIFSTWPVHISQSRAAMCPPLFDLWQGSRADCTEATCSPLELCCWCQTSRTCARLLWWVTSPSPRAVPANGRNCPPVDQPNRKRAKLDANLTWLVARQGRLQSCLKASLCRHNKGSCLPFSHSSAMELTSVWKAWDCSCCLVIQLKIFYFPLESLKICACVCERLSTGKCDLSKYLSID